MKRVFLMALAAIALTACEKADLSQFLGGVPTSTITFSVAGDFNNPTFTRALSADGNEMTDLWILDYADGSIKQTIHQTPQDDDFGKPSLALTYGSHRVLFLASRGTNPAYKNGIVTWEKVSDTFYKAYDITVAKSTSPSHSVALNRVVAKLMVTVDDAIATGTTAILLEPDMWYDGFDLLSGEPTQTDAYSVTHTLPSDWVGTSGKSFGIWTLSADEEWTTDVTVTSKAGTTVNARHTIKSVPLKANRTTTYHGNMYGEDDAWTISLNATWDTPINETF